MREKVSTLRVSRLKEQGDEDDFKDAAPAERIAVVWQLTLDAWSFKEQPVAQHRLQRDVVRIQRSWR